MRKRDAQDKPHFETRCGWAQDDESSDFLAKGFLNRKVPSAVPIARDHSLERHPERCLG